MTLRLVVLASGTGTNLQALLDACAEPAFGATVVAVGADRPGIGALDRAERAGIPTFVVRMQDHPTREEWDRGLADAVAVYSPDLVVSAGFMKILGATFLGRFTARCINTHPALLPAFPGAAAVSQALTHGVKVTGCTVHVIDHGVDTGPILAQAAVPVLEGDDEDSLHERIKSVERTLLVETVGAMAHGGWSVDGRSVTVGGSDNGTDGSAGPASAGTTGQRIDDTHRG